MYNGIGLSTPRGSGTNGYVQKNLSFITNTKQKETYKTDFDVKRADASFFKEPNREIAEHERKRKIEVKCFELEQEMEDQGRKVNKFRKVLLNELKSAGVRNDILKHIEPFEEHVENKTVIDSSNVVALKNNAFKEALGIQQDYCDGNSLELIKRRKIEEEETKKLNAVAKDMETIDSSGDSCDDKKVDKQKRKHKKKSKKHKRTVSESTVTDSVSPNESHERKHKSHKKSKKNKHSHAKD